MKLESSLWKIGARSHISYPFNKRPCYSPSRFILSGDTWSLDIVLVFIVRVLLNHVRSTWQVTWLIDRAIRCSIHSFITATWSVTNLIIDSTWLLALRSMIALISSRGCRLLVKECRSVWCCWDLFTSWIFYYLVGFADIGLRRRIFFSNINDYWLFIFEFHIILLVRRPCIKISSGCWLLIICLSIAKLRTLQIKLSLAHCISRCCLAERKHIIIVWLVEEGEGLSIFATSSNLMLLFDLRITIGVKIMRISVWHHHHTLSTAINIWTRRSCTLLRRRLLLGHQASVVLDLICSAVACTHIIGCTESVSGLSFSWSLFSWMGIMHSSIMMTRIIIGCLYSTSYFTSRLYWTF